MSELEQLVAHPKFFALRRMRDPDGWMIEVGTKPRSIDFKTFASFDRGSSAIECLAAAACAWLEENSDLPG